MTLISYSEWKNPWEPTVLYPSYSYEKQRKVFFLCLSPTGITCDIIDCQSLLGCIEYFRFMFIPSYHRKVKVKTAPYCFQASSSWTWRFCSNLQAVLPADETVLFASKNIQQTHTSATFEISPQILVQLIPPSYSSFQHSDQHSNRKLQKLKSQFLFNNLVSVESCWSQREIWKKWSLIRIENFSVFLPFGSPLGIHSKAY